jgi:hypothetical protein
MPTRKQRRRRQKELRHEYEYVYVDEEGREVEVDPDEVDDRDSRTNGKRDSKRAADTSRGGRKGQQTRPVREVSPPSWRRVGKRALLFGPLIFIAFSVINSGQPVATRVAVAAVYTAFFVPLMYLMDRTMYRTYLKRTGRQAPQRPNRKR